MENKQKQGLPTLGSGEIAVGTLVAAEVAFLAADVLSDRIPRRSSGADNKLPRGGWHSIERLSTVFSELSWKGKVAIGAVILGSGLATGYLINKWRNGESCRDELSPLSNLQTFKHSELQQRMRAPLQPTLREPFTK